MFRTALAFSLMIAISGCISMPSTETTLSKMYNVASFGSSQFDGTKYIRVANMNCSNAIIFELYQDTVKYKKGIVLLKAGSNSITNIDNGKSLFIKIDGKTHSFESSDPVTEYETIYFSHGASIPFSYKTYVIPDAIVKQAASSEVFLAKMNLLNHTFVEGKCSPVTLQESREQYKALNLNIMQEHVDTGNNFAAINGFREFVKMMQTTSW